ncbi:MAG: LLM class F420-dependent oxidoreductase [Acidimicrobiaceae bacterium]|nr:LLM class F420-dependent oxidoreductase [Acidimicrobiaceae bacterium]
MKIDVLLSGDLTQMGSLSEDLAGAGADGLFTYEGKSDVFFPLVRAGELTDCMLYTNVAIAIPRSPMHLAYQSWDLQRLSDGRFALGLGSQIRPHIENRYGSVWDSPLGQMREIIEATKAIFDSWQAQSSLNFIGKWTRHTLASPMLTPDPLPQGPPPIWLAALGPKMTQLAGEVADGLLVHPFTSQSHLETHTIPNLSKGLAKRSEAAQDFVVTVGAIVGIHDGSDEGRLEAETIVRGLLGFYGSTPAYRPVLDSHGWGDLQPRLRQLTKEGRWDQLGTLFDDAQISTLSVIGTAEEVGEELRNRFSGIADRLALSIPQGIQRSDLSALVEATRS